LSNDPIVNVLVLGDLYEPLLRVSDVYAAYEDKQIAGACSIYRAYSTPSVVLSAGPADVKEALIEEALSHISHDFISLCPPEDAYLFEKLSASRGCHHEQQMVLRDAENFSISKARASRVKKREFELLSKFYVDHHAEAWTPIQFEAGPYYCIKQDGKIVSAAGIHLVTPQIAQLGNVVTDEAYRNRGFATACTSALAADLSSKGRIISLFVRTDNAPAIHMYKRLGFAKSRDIAFLFMRKHSS